MVLRLLLGQLLLLLETELTVAGGGLRCWWDATCRCRHARGGGCRLRVGVQKNLQLVLQLLNLTLEQVHVFLRNGLTTHPDPSRVGVLLQQLLFRFDLLLQLLLFLLLHQGEVGVSCLIITNLLRMGKTSTLAVHRCNLQ